MKSLFSLMSILLFLCGFKTAGDSKDTVVRFRDLTITISNFEIFNAGHYVKYVQTTDTVYLEAELGELFEGKLIKISSPLENLQLRQHYETTISVYVEADHCDLTDWKHYLSPVLPVKQLQPNTFIANSYTPKQREIFPPTTVEEFKKAVQNHCDPYYFPKIRKMKQFTPDNSLIGISSYFLDITGKDP